MVHGQVDNYTGGIGNVPREVMTALLRAILSLLHLRILLLTVLPFVVSMVIWGVLLYLCLQPTIDWLHAWFSDNGAFRTAGELLGGVGLGALTTIVVPLIAMWVLLPLMILTALLFVGMFAMPAIVSHVGQRHYPELEKRRGGNLWGSLRTGLLSFLLFVILWILVLPLSLFPPLTFVAQPLLWGWLTYRVMAYDALSEHASAQECRMLLQEHRWPLLLIGTLTGLLGAAPTLLWLGGVFSVVFFPFLAGGAIWLYVLVFVFTGLWFEHYCLSALAWSRRGRLT